MEVEAEVSLYPLGEQHLSRAIESFMNVLEEHDCEAEVGPMSSLVHGESFMFLRPYVWGTNVPARTATVC